MRSTLRDVQVAVRIRPLLPREVSAEAQVAFWRGDADGIEVDMSSKADKDKGDAYAENEAAALYERKENGSVSRWSFMDALYGPNSDNKSLFSSFVLPLISCVMDGQNCSILAYGQTASGKTFSIFGSRKPRAGFVQFSTLLLCPPPPPILLFSFEGSILYSYNYNHKNKNPPRPLWSRKGGLISAFLLSIPPFGLLENRTRGL